VNDNTAYSGSNNFTSHSLTCFYREELKATSSYNDDQDICPVAWKSWAIVGGICVVLVLQVMCKLAPAIMQKHFDKVSLAICCTSMTCMALHFHGEVAFADFSIDGGENAAKRIFTECLLFFIFASSTISQTTRFTKIPTIAFSVCSVFLMNGFGFALTKQAYRQNWAWTMVLANCAMLMSTMLSMSVSLALEYKLRRTFLLLLQWDDIRKREHDLLVRNFDKFVFYSPAVIIDRPLRCQQELMLPPAISELVLRHASPIIFEFDFVVVMFVTIDSFSKITESFRSAAELFNQQNTLYKMVVQ
jgi:hypothetical protein